MLKRLFTPMECDRACRRRVYASWGLMLGLMLLVGFIVELASRNGLQIQDRKRGVLFVGIMGLLCPIVVLSLCRSHAAYQSWRQSNPLMIMRLLRSIAPMLFPRKPDSFRFCMCLTLVASVGMIGVGVFLIVMAFN